MMIRHGAGKIDSYTQTSGEVCNVKLGSDNKGVTELEVINEEELLLTENDSNEEESETIDKQ